MVEQLTLNQRVAGSSPARFTNTLKDLDAIAVFTDSPTVATRVQPQLHFWENCLVSDFSGPGARVETTSLYVLV